MIFTMNAQMQAQVGHDIQLLAEQVRLIRFRQEAVETVLLNGGVRVAFLRIFKPAVVMKMIDDATAKCYADFAAALAEAQADQAKKAKGIVLPQGVGVIH